MRKVSWTIVLQTISRHSYTWEMSSMKISIFTEKEEGRKNSCQYSQINHPQCQDRNPIVVLPFGSLMRHILKQPSNTTKFECFSHVVKSDSEYSRARWLIKEGQKRRAHDPPCIIVTKISALFAIFLSPQTHDLFVMHHIIDHPPQGICETLVSASTHEHRTNSYRSGLAPVTVQIESRHLLITCKNPSTQFGSRACHNCPVSRHQLQEGCQIERQGHWAHINASSIQG